MNLCQVLGTVTATHKHPAFAGKRLMVVQPLDEARRPAGKSFIAVDERSQSGPGDLVLVLREGNGARQLLGDRTSPVRSIIVGVVDAVDVEDV